MLMILARLVRSESFWAVAKVRSPHTGPEFGYPRRGAPARVRAWRCEGRPPLPHHFVCVEKSTLPYLTRPWM